MRSPGYRNFIHNLGEIDIVRKRTLPTVSHVILLISLLWIDLLGVRSIEHYWKINWHILLKKKNTLTISKNSVVILALIFIVFVYIKEINKI